jgi:hypothetical protein
MQSNILSVAMQQTPSPYVPQARRNAGSGTKKIIVRQSKHYTPADKRDEVLRKLSIFRLAVRERAGIVDSLERADYDSFLSNIKDDIETSFVAERPSPSSFTRRRKTNNNYRDTLTLFVRFGVYGEARITVHLKGETFNGETLTLSSNIFTRIEYDLSTIDLSFCDIAGAYQAVESITREYVEFIESGSIKPTHHRVLNAYPELQNRLQNILRYQYARTQATQKKHMGGVA